MTRMTRIVILLLGAFLLAPLIGLADTIGFTGGNGSTGTGSVSYTAAVGDSFTVTGALINTLSIDGTPYAVSGGVLNLVSGPTSSIVSGCTGGPCIAMMGGGGSLSVDGGVLALSIGTGSTLISASYLPGGFLSFSGSGSGTSGTYSALLDPSSVSLNTAISNLLADLGISSGSNTEMDINLAFSGATYSGHNAVTTSDVGVTTTPVPEPSSLLLLLTGIALLSSAVIYRKTLGVPSERQDL